jgi:hypothetical protein
VLEPLLELVAPIDELVLEPPLDSVLEPLAPDLPDDDPPRPEPVKADPVDPDPLPKPEGLEVDPFALVDPPLSSVEPGDPQAATTLPPRSTARRMSACTVTSIRKEELEGVCAYE